MATSELVTPVGRPVERRRYRLGRRSRKLLLTLHVVAAGAWLGLDVGFAVLACTALATDDPHTASVAYQALRIVAVWPMLTAGLVSLVTGVLLGIGTKYGLVRYWWVAVKLVINVVFVLLITFALRPGLGRVASAARRLVADPATEIPYPNLVGPLVVGPTLLLVATVLSVVKPWGRIRGRAGQARRR